MRHIYQGGILLLSLIIFVVAFIVFWVNRPVTCLPDCTSVVMMNRRLKNYNLRNAIMVRSDLRSSDMRNANLSGADFSGANLVNVNLSNANLTGAKFIGANMTNADLRNTVLDGTDFTGTVLVGSNMTRTDLTKARLAGIYLDSANLIEINMTGVSLSGVWGNGINLTGSQLSDVVLAGSTLSNGNLSGAVLKNANLSGALLNLANLSGTDLSGANLAGSSLIGSDLSSSNLTNSSLVGVNAIGADFSGAIFNGANLTGVRLFEFELEHVDLLADPMLLELNLLQLSEVQTNANLSGVAFDAHTLWPTGKTALLKELLGGNFIEGQLDPLAATASESLPDQASGSSDAESYRLNSPAQVIGDITVIGSSDVLTLTDMIGQQFSAQGFPDTISLENVDNSSGFQRLCQPESDIDILNTNRLIRDDELALCAAIGRTPVRFRIGTDAIAMVINPSNEFANDVTLKQLKTIFTAERWNEVDPSWPAEPIVRYIPSISSGESASRDLFLRTVLGINTDSADAINVLLNAPGVNHSETDQDLILGVANNPYAIGFLPITAYEQNADILALLMIDGAELNAETVESGAYALARPLLLYTDPTTLRENSQVVAFLDFYLANVRQFDSQTSYFISSDLVLDQAKTTLQEASAPSPTNTLAVTDTITEEVDFAEIFTVPSPLIPLAPLASTDGSGPPAVPDETELADLAGSILIIGNSLVLSPTETIAAGFKGLGFSDVITMTSVTSEQAFEFFCGSDQVDIVGMNRLIQDNETGDCRDIGRSPLPFRVGTDAVAIVANPNNDFLRNLTREELALIFSANNWSDVNPDWPMEPIQRFVPPIDSSVTDLFVNQVLDGEKDQLLLTPNLISVDNRGRQAQAINTNTYALGFMEYPAYQRNAGLLNLIAVDGIVPDDTTIEDGSYALIRPLLLYASDETLVAKPHVAAFINFYLTNTFVAMEPFNYVPASGQALDDARTTLRQAVNPPDSTPTPDPFSLSVPTLTP